MLNDHLEDAPHIQDSDVVRDAELARSSKFRHAFFTRRGGVSGTIYSGLNAGIGSNDEPDAVAQNRSRAMHYLGVTSADLATPWQVHSAEAVIAEGPFTGERPRADAIVTKRSGLAVGVVTADCGPVLFADETAGVVGAAHAGWRGATGGVLEATIAAMERCGARRENIVAVLGPTITQPNYEVGADLAEKVSAGDADRFFAAGRTPDKRQFDLPGLIVARLAAAGVAARFVGQCTYGDEAGFYSFRRTTHRDEADYGRQLSAIVIL